MKPEWKSTLEKEKGQNLQFSYRISMLMEVGIRQRIDELKKLKVAVVLLFSRNFRCLDGSFSEEFQHTKSPKHRYGSFIFIKFSLEQERKIKSEAWAKTLGWLRSECRFVVMRAFVMACHFVTLCVTFQFTVMFWRI